MGMLDETSSTNTKNTFSSSTGSKERLHAKLKTTHLTKSKLKKIPAIKSNPISDHLLDILCQSSDPGCPGKAKSELKESALEDLRLFIEPSRLNDKLSFLFKIYDTDRDGKISNIELFRIIKLHSDLDDGAIQQIIDNTFMLVGKTEHINEEEFKRLVLSNSKNLSMFMRAG